ncbi:MAG: hypothetical protein COV31_02660 [Candidatus Yanofskybacteria bacterium CG10_big_fil_rev_8_21_14_0_10_46_23]|uniref:DUF3048 domain-containing protein n=1 Tax=Candidatus Yanofskybacteria bacterium CG10_big_fil_rev_8_21_14_0_10_46_23 TaxID=1975098 RepID=A0A2H0R485_9BACT|nr:MAG: hypothetical protein COV31_02660 [Candidatus Yanofskybacteria bacterium CG10_big_fil_rev_8_21_14_0_10_46_23]
MNQISQTSRQRKLKFSKPRTLIFLGVITFFVILALWFSFFSESRFFIKNEDPGPREQTGALLGQPCPFVENRPVAVMLASDPVARPLAGVGQADIVLEMPVTPDGVTRMMALFQCQQPERVGSIRSARAGFLPFVASFDAIFGHWGGEREALADLNAGVVDNLDALPNRFNTFYRQNGIRSPHDGFSSYERLVAGAIKSGYRIENRFEGFARSEEPPARTLANLAESVMVPYAGSYEVRWHYSAEKKTYQRSRGGQLEIEANTGMPVQVKNIIVLETTGVPFEGQYLDLAVVSQGRGQFYRDGVSQGVIWSKADFGAPLLLENLEGQEIKLAPGASWIHFIIS